MLMAWLFVEEQAGVGLVLHTSIVSENKLFASRLPLPGWFPHAMVGGLKVSVTGVLVRPTPDGTAPQSGCV